MSKWAIELFSTPFDLAKANQRRTVASCLNGIGKIWGTGSAFFDVKV
jgi:hypothetical protein